MSANTTPGSMLWAQHKIRAAIAKMQLGPSLGVASTGFIDIDRMTGGLWPGDLIWITGSHLVGKTALALNIAEHAALRESKAVSVFSLDLPAEQVVVRLLCSIGRISITGMQSGKLTGHEQQRLELAIEQMGASRLHLDHSRDLNLDLLGSKLSILTKHSGPLGLVVVDDLQLVGATERRLVGDDGLAEALHRLKHLAAEFHCPIIVLSQVPAEVDVRQNSASASSDLDGSDSAADVVMKIHGHGHDQNAAVNMTNQPGVVTVTFSKRRDGLRALTRLVFLRHMAKFESLACQTTGKM